MVRAVKPELLKLPAGLYGVPYDTLALRWFRERYEPSADCFFSERGLVASSREDECRLRFGSGASEYLLPIVTLSHLQASRASLPEGTEIGVAAMRFLDDNIFYEVVSSNLRCGIKYLYLLPEDQHGTYKAFVDRVARGFPELCDRLDGALSHFVPRPKLDFPVNYVVHVLPGGELQGYVGLLYDDRARLQQIADPKLAWRLFDGFRWALLVAQDASVRQRLIELRVRAGTETVRRAKTLLG